MTASLHGFVCVHSQNREWSLHQVTVFDINFIV